jgi:hypothetical protein
MNKISGLLTDSMSFNGDADKWRCGNGAFHVAFCKNHIIAPHFLKAISTDGDE